MFDRSLHIGNLMCFKINNKLFFLTVGMAKHRLSETRSGLYTKKYDNVTSCIDDKKYTFYIYG